MKDNYNILYKGGTGEIIEKKSRFIANVYSVKSEEEAQGFIDAARKKYWDARHNCYAYVIGINNEIQRYSDDGEPQGTAGRPMLDVITGEGVHDCLVITTRYFGGILLGTGGLVRAYQMSVKEGLANSEIMEKRRGIRVKVICDYTDAGRITHIVSNNGIFTENVTYGADVEYCFLADLADTDMFIENITEATAGQSLIEKGDEVWFGTVGGKVVFG